MLVAGVVESVRPAADAKAITLKVELDPDAGPVRGDPDRLRQVVENILGNAFKFTPKAGVVTVRLVRDEANARLVVTDTGAGIDADFLPHVFERFRQFDRTRARAPAGLGLGLAIVRHIVDLHTGQVHAESAGPGRGATFTVTLPIAAADAADAGVGEPSVADRDGGERLDGITVLLVETDADTRELVSTILAQSGAVVMAATNAREAASTAQRIRPHVLIGDLAMPGQDGLAMVSQVKSWAERAGVALPALALTGFARAEDREQAMAAGFDLYVTKPVEPRELVRAVARLSRR